MRYPAASTAKATQNQCSASTANARQPTGSAASECVWPTTITKYTTVGLGALSAAWIASTLWAPASSQAATAAIGRLTVNTKHCRFVAPSNQRLSCYRIELARKTDNVLRLRFIGQGEQPGRGRSLTFVAINPEQPVPLSCKQGQCELTSKHWQGAVVGVAEAITTSLGLAEGLPKAWPAQGSCKLNKRQFTCTADLSTGEALSAEGRL